MIKPRQKKRFITFASVHPKYRNMVTIRYKRHKGKPTERILGKVSSLLKRYM